MNNIISKFLLAGDMFMHEIYLRQSRFTYNACMIVGHSPKKKRRKEYKNVKKLETLVYLEE